MSEIKLKSGNRYLITALQKSKNEIIRYSLQEIECLEISETSIKLRYGNAKGSPFWIDKKCRLDVKEDLGSIKI